MGRITFAQAIYLALKGELPDEKVGRLIDAVLVSSVDHGATPPSILAARTVASTGAPSPRRSPPGSWRSRACTGAPSRRGWSR